MINTENSTIDNKEVITIGAMTIVHHELSKHNMLRREYISPVPVLSQGEYEMVMVSPLLDIKKNEVGYVRAFVFVPATDSGNILLRVEWTKELFEFWFRNQIKIIQGNFDKNKVSDFMRETVDKISHTINRDVPLKSQIRMLKKIKKNQTRDKALRSGLVLG